LKTKTVDAGVDITASVEFDFFEKAGLSVKFSSKTSITNTNEENMQVDKTSSYTMPIKVSPMSVVTVEHAYIQREVPVRYSGTVQVDAAISNNLDGIKLMSQIYSNPADRKFVFAGVVLSSQLNDSDVVLGYTKLRDQDCAEQLGKSVAMPETFTREYSKE
jgi:hypothetical protein